MREKLFEINNILPFKSYFSDTRYRFDDWLTSAKDRNLITIMEYEPLYLYCMQDPVEHRRNLEQDLVKAFSYFSPESKNELNLSESEKEIIKSIREGKLQVIKIPNEESY